MKNIISPLILIGTFLTFTNLYSYIYCEENNKNNTDPKISNWYFTMEPLDNWSYENVIDNSGIAQMLGFGPIIGVNLIPKDEL